MRKLILAVPLLLAGCANPYTPVPIEITDEAAYNADVSMCQKAAAAYKPQPAIGDIAQAAVSGGTGTIAYAPINPLIPALGAAGGAANSAAAGFDITGQSHRNVAKHCVEEKTRRDHSAIVANPDN